MNQKLLRQWHGYVGAFIAPSVFFFALTGAFQLFDLHEAGGGYTPPPIVERFGQLHKKQVFSLGKHHRAPPAKARSANGLLNNPGPVKADHENGDPAAITTLMLKFYFLVVALGLALSTVFGVWIALTLPRSRKPTLILLFIGALVPVSLLSLQSRLI